MADNIVERLKARTCPAGEPWTADNPSTDHGHTDCWLYWLAIDEIERLRAERDTERALADKLAHELNDFIEYGDHGSLRRAKEALAIHKEARRG